MVGTVQRGVVWTAVSLAMVLVVGLLLQPAAPLLAAGSVDQQQTNEVLTTGGPNIDVAQTFTVGAGFTGNLDQVDLALGRSGTLSGTMTV
jgi:hypothetical protein